MTHDTWLPLPVVPGIVLRTQPNRMPGVRATKWDRGDWMLQKMLDYVVVYLKIMITSCCSYDESSLAKGFGVINCRLNNFFKDSINFPTSDR